MSPKSIKSFTKSDPLQSVLFLVGPTASGKTDVLCELSRLLPIEVISCDSMQNYKELKILSQAPGIKARRQVTHHAVGELSVSQIYSVAHFIKNAVKRIPMIHEKNKLPVISGGTGLYIHSLLDGLFEGPKESPSIRKRYREMAAEYGVQFLHDLLEKLDPAAARILHPNDERRIIRALEVIELTGKYFSELKKNRSGLQDKYCCFLWGLDWPRDMLYQRINTRANLMFRRGVAAEVSQLTGLRLSKTARMCLGLKTLRGYLNHELTRDEALEEISLQTRRYAKRQISWFRRDSRIRWISCKEGRSAKEIALQWAGMIREQIAI